MKRAVLGFAFGLGAVGGAASLSSCGAGDALPPNAPPIAHTWLSECGACHTRVEPKTRTRAALEAALSRHHRRVSLTDDEWAQMVDFLAGDR